MERAASGGMLDLRLATETIRQYKPLARNFAQARSQLMLINLHREIVFVLLKSEAAGHAAASVVKDFRVGSHRLEKLFLGIEADDRLLMAMPVYQHVAMQCGRLVILLREKFRQSEDLAVQAFGVLVVRPQVEHLVPEYGQAARLQTDHGYAGFNGRFQVNENVTEELVRFDREIRSRTAGGRNKAARRGTNTRNPASSSTSVAATATSG